MNSINVLDKVSLLSLAFKGLDDAELNEMAALTHIATYPAEHVLCHEGAYEEVFYIVADGNAEISKTIGEQEGKRILRIASKGDLIGEMALIQNVPRAATVCVLSELTVLEMSKKDFETMLSQSPRMALDIIRITLDRLRENDQTTIADLQKSNKVLRHLDRNKLEFIQVAAHELRTPLTVLKGYVNVLRASPELNASGALDEVVNGIVKGADRMHEIVNMMLDVSRIDSETMKVGKTIVSIQVILNELLYSLSKEISNRNIQILLETTQEIPVIYGDPVLLQKALYQLMINAIKYTPDGGKIKISMQPATLDENIPAVEIRFVDSGIGVEAEHHDLIFEKFYQVGNVALHSSGKTAFKSGGPGLGLALVRGVAKAHGGRVWVESSGYDEVNFSGSVFHFVVPIKKETSD